MLQGENETEEPDYSHLSNLPPDMLAQIFRFLPPRDVMNLRLVNKSLAVGGSDALKELKLAAKLAYEQLIEEAERMPGLVEEELYGRAYRYVDLIKAARGELIKAIFAVHCETNKLKRQVAVDELFFKLIRVCFKTKWLLASALLFTIECEPSPAAVKKAASLQAAAFIELQSKRGPRLS